MFDKHMLLITSLILFLFRALSVNLILTSKHSFFLSTAVILFLQAGIICSLKGSVPLQPAAYCTGTVLFLLFTQLLYHENRSVKLFISLMLMIPAVFSRIISGLLVPGGRKVLLYTLFFLIHLLFLIPAVYSLRKSRPLLSERTSDTDLYPFCVFPLAQLMMFCFCFLSPAYGRSHPAMVISAVTINICADIALMHILQRSMIFREQQTAVTENNAKIRHDIENHLLTVQALINTNSISEASEYADTLIETVRKNDHFPHCRNNAVSAYLEEYFIKCTASGISFETDIQLPDDLNINTVDLISVYSNLLDNAFEACSGRPDAKISLDTVFQEPYLTITCRNTASTAHDKKRRYQELERGLGFLILTDIARKYDGLFTHSIEDGIFSAEIILRNKTEAQYAENSSMR